MKEINQFVSEIDNNVRKLIGQVNHNRKELEFLKEENLRLQAENDALKQRLANNEILIAARQIAEGLDDYRAGSESTRKKLNELIREIDKCIIMLDD